MFETNTQQLRFNRYLPEPGNDGDADKHEEEFSKSEIVDEKEDVVRNQHDERERTFKDHTVEKRSNRKLRKTKTL